MRREETEALPMRANKSDETRQGATKYHPSNLRRRLHASKQQRDATVAMINKIEGSSDMAPVSQIKQERQKKFEQQKKEEVPSDYMPKSSEALATSERKRHNRNGYKLRIIKKRTRFSNNAGVRFIAVV